MTGWGEGLLLSEAWVWLHPELQWRLLGAYIENRSLNLARAGYIEHQVALEACLPKTSVEDCLSSGFSSLYGDSICPLMKQWVENDKWVTWAYGAPLGLSTVSSFLNFEIWGDGGTSSQGVGVSGCLHSI